MPEPSAWSHDEAKPIKPLRATVPTGDPAFPNVQVEIAEGHEVCAGQSAPFADAPGQ